MSEMPEPPDGTRMLIRLRPDNDILPSTAPSDWLVVWRDELEGHTNYVVPDGESCWFGTTADCVDWSYLASQISEAYRIPAIPAWKEG